MNIFRFLSSDTEKASLVRWMIIIFLAALMSFASSLKNTYVLDDEIIVRDNPDSKSVTQIKEIFSKHYWANMPKSDPPSLKDQTTVYLYRPIAIFSYAITSDLLGNKAQMHHFVNVMIHIINSILILWVIYFWTQSSLIAKLTGLIFAIHPIHTDPINILTGRSELLVCTMGMLTLIGLYKIIVAEKNYWFAIILVSWFLCLGSKESGVLVLFLAGMLILAHFYKPDQDFLATFKLIFFKMLKPAIALFLGTMSYAILRKNALGYWAGTQNGPEGMVNVSFIVNPIYSSPFSERFYTGVTIVAKYIMLHFVPYPLLIDYSYNCIEIIKSAQNIKFWSSFVLVIVLAVVSLIRISKDKYFSVGIIFWLISILFFSNIFIPFGTIFGERLMYLPSVGFCLALSIVLSNIYGYIISKADISQAVLIKKYNLLATLALLIITIISIVYCHTQNSNYQNTSDCIAKTIERSNGCSCFQLYTLGSLYSDNQQYPEAIKLLEQATEIYPIDDAYDRLSVAYLNLQNIPKAAQAAQKAVELTPQWWPYRKQWALCLAQLQRTDEAIQQFELALKQSPNNALMHLSLGNLWKRQNQLAKAESEYKLALQSSNPNPYTYKMLGDLYLQQEKNLLAISAYEAFLKVLPNDPNAVSLKETVKNLKYKVEQEPLKSQKKQ